MTENARQLFYNVMDSIINEYHGENRKKEESNKLTIEIEPPKALTEVTLEDISKIVTNKNISDVEIEQVTDLINSAIHTLNFLELGLPGMHELMVKAKSLQELNVLTSVPITENMQKFIDDLVADTVKRNMEKYNDACDMTLFMEETVADLLKKQNINFSKSELVVITDQINSRIEAINIASHMQSKKKQ